MWTEDPPYMQCEENKYIKENALLFKKISGRRRLARRQAGIFIECLSCVVFAQNWIHPNP